MEDYIAELTEIDDLEAASLVDFTTWIREIIESGTNPRRRKKPAFCAHCRPEVQKGDEDNVSNTPTAHDKEVLIVTATTVQAHFLQRELREKGSGPSPHVTQSKHSRPSCNRARMQSSLRRSLMV